VFYTEFSFKHKTFVNFHHKLDWTGFYETWFLLLIKLISTNENWNEITVLKKIRYYTIVHKNWLAVENAKIQQ